MLTADLVEVKRSDDELKIVRLSPKRRALLVELVLTFHRIAVAHVGSSRAEIARALSLIDSPSKENRLRKAAWKLVEDACTFEEAAGDAAATLRAAIFGRAAEIRKGLDEGVRLDRTGVLAEVGKERGLGPDALEGQLFSDLREAQRLLTVKSVDAREIGESYEFLETEAVLLRAVNVTLDLEGGRDAFRRFHRELRFRGLLFRVEETEEGHRFVIDGPFSLFESVTKYGLELALAFRAARRAGPFRMMALVKWPGKEGVKRNFIVRARSAETLTPVPFREHPILTDLRKEISELGGEWKARTSERLFPVPGLGLLVPDLVLERKGGSGPIFVELLGFWSREAVWERIERAKDLPEPFIFLVSKKLRVSEETLSADVPASLVVFGATLRAKQVLAAAEGLVTPLRKKAKVGATRKK